jgi:phenylalanyl-tRNA synthetase alpha chain
MRNKWLKKDGTDLVIAEKNVKDTTRQLLQKIQETRSLADNKVLTDLKKRKLVKLEKSIKYTITKGPKYAKQIPVCRLRIAGLYRFLPLECANNRFLSQIEVTDLTAEMLANNSWQTANFKEYNFNALGGSQSPGALHPLMKVREEFRKIFFNQGFVEMPTSR